MGVGEHVVQHGGAPPLPTGAYETVQHDGAQVESRLEMRGPLFGLRTHVPQD